MADEQQGKALEPASYPLASGRKVVVSPGDESHPENLRVFSPQGKVEVEILLTAEGPLVRVAGASLSLDSASSISLRADGPVGIEAEELRVRTRRSVHLNGETIRLNCDDDASAAPGQPAGHLRGPGCGGGHGAQ
ncbi:MAG: hypothetical protein ACKO26_13700 [Planctomycetota bacterium]